MNRQLGPIWKFVRFNSKYYECKVEDAINIRLDRFLENFISKTEQKVIPYAHLQKLIRKKEVAVNGKRVKDPSTKLELNDEIKVAKFLFNAGKIVKEKRKQLELTEDQIKEIRSWVLFMNEEVIVLNKPPGIAVQGGTGTRFHIDAILSALKYDEKDLPRLVHRLDKETSGALVLARTHQGAIRMSEWFSDRESGLKKVYWALVNGKPKPSSGRVKMYLKKQDKLMIAMESPDAESKMSISEYSVIDTARVISLLCLMPVTGRTHQLRVHCATGLGCYILGDRKYGYGIPETLGLDEEKGQENLYLHAREISLPYMNERKERVIVTAPLFDAFRKVMKSFDLRENGVGKRLDSDLLKKNLQSTRK